MGGITLQAMTVQPSPEMATHAPVGLAAVSMGGRLLQANEAMAEILGCDGVAQLMATPLGTFHQVPELAAEIVLEHLEQGAFRGLEMDFRHLSGAAITARVSARVSYIDGTPCILAAIEDVTSMKEAQRESSHSQKMEAVARFAAGVAHDYNNLLTAIIGEARQLLGELPDEAEWRDSVTEILRAARRAGTITRRLLVFSKSEVTRTETVDLNAAVQAREPTLRRLLAGDVDLELRLDPGAGPVRIDPRHIEQMLYNLVSNARDAMPGGGRVVVETGAARAPDDTEGLDFHPAVEPGDYTSLAVGDTGIGMNQETRRRIFDPFFTTKPIGGGAGLGLTTVYAQVRRAGGHISVLSAPAYGTLVRILLPVCAPQSDAEPDDAARRAPPGEGSRDQRTRTVLVVDDERPVRRVMKKVLARMGCTVLEAPDAFSAQEVVKSHQGPIDLLITDVMMPRMKGTELAQWLAEECPGVPVLLVSGYTDSPLIQEWVDRDPDVFLAKPFEPEELMEQVEKRWGAG